MSGDENTAKAPQEQPDQLEPQRGKTLTLENVMDELQRSAEDPSHRYPLAKAVAGEISKRLPPEKQQRAADLKRQLEEQRNKKGDGPPSRSR